MQRTTASYALSDGAPRGVRGSQQALILATYVPIRTRDISRETFRVFSHNRCLRMRRARTARARLAMTQILGKLACQRDKLRQRQGLGQLANVNAELDRRGKRFRHCASAPFRRRACFLAVTQFVRASPRQRVSRRPLLARFARLIRALPIQVQGHCRSHVQRLLMKAAAVYQRRRWRQRLRIGNNDLNLWTKLSAPWSRMANKEDLSSLSCRISAKNLTLFVGISRAAFLFAALNDPLWVRLVPFVRISRRSWLRSESLRGSRVEMSAPVLYRSDSLASGKRCRQ